MSTVTPIVSPAYVNQANVEHRDIVPVVLVNPATGQLVPSEPYVTPTLQDLSGNLVANTVNIVTLPPVTSYLRLENNNAAGNIVFQFNVNPSIGNGKEIVLTPGSSFTLSNKFIATNIQILRALSGTFLLIVI